MTELDPEREQQASNGEGLDRALDAALAKYASVEPRTGLPDRILAKVLRANLRAQQSPPRTVWWRWSWAIAAAVIVVGALLAWKSVGPSHLMVAHRPAPATQNPRTPAQQEASSRRSLEPVPPARSAMRPDTRPHVVAAAANPKLDVFPSPQPLSEEELALAQYVRNFPTDAKVVAQAQEADEKEILAKIQALANESGESN